jgi:16S rRNA (adenine1518-N6/adenine1519-N6)-dimethyltransferase
MLRLRKPLSFAQLNANTMTTPRRRFGQNFLRDTNVVQQMLAAIGPRANQAFLEVGPGRGALTAPLLDHGVELSAIEIDRDLAAELMRRQRPGSQLRVIEGDALRYPLSGFIPADGGLRIVGNLPYNLSTPLLFHLTQAMQGIADLHLLLQREVVTRMAASPGSRDYGRLSVMLQYRCQVDGLFEVPPAAFEPAPKVTSRFVRLRPHVSPPTAIINEGCLGIVVARAFGQRRKTLRNALRGLLEASDLIAVDIDPSARAEQIDLAGFARLANRLAEQTVRKHG